MTIMFRIMSVAVVACALASCQNEPAAPPMAAAGLDIPHISQETLLCVPTSAAMILSFYHDPQSPRYLKSLASGHPLPAGGTFNDYSITYYRDLIRAVGYLGYRWDDVELTDSHDDFGQGLARIESELQAGHPVMIDLSLAQGGHTMVVRGFDAQGQTISVVDPAQPAPGRHDMSFAQLEADWNEHAYGNHGRAMIVTRPKTS